jgi:hypothetical protein
MPDATTTASRTWSPTLPFLVLAYPVTFLLYQGGRYCEPVCFEPTPMGFVAIAGTLIAVGVIATGIALGLRRIMENTDSTAVRPLIAPSRWASILLLTVFGGFVLFLTLDAVALYEAFWKPIVLPLSFVPFLPVWLLYGLTYPLAVLYSIAGVEPSPFITVLTRSVVIAVGFPLSAVMQTYLVDLAVRWQTGDENPMEAT